MYRTPLHLILHCTALHCAAVDCTTLHCSTYLNCRACWGRTGTRSWWTTAPIIDMLTKFDAVTSACFSRKLGKDWEKVIESFITSVWDLISFCRLTLNRKLSVSWKVHMLVNHLKRLLGRLGEGLADHSEQTGESGHHKV